MEKLAGPDTAAAQPPRISQALAIRIGDIANGYGITAMHPEIRREAMAALGRLEALCRPAGVEHAEVWLKPLAAGCTVILTRKEWEVRSAAILPILADLPASVMTPATTREAMLEFSYFPGAKEVHAFLLAKCRDWLRDRDALRKLVAVGVPPPAPVLREADRKAITDRFRSQFSAVMADNVPPEPIAPKAAIVARCATGEHLARLRDNPVVQQALAMQREEARRKSEAGAA